ncbi:MAG TPA: hypothetical protein VJH03_12980 [Blastocatellia bacterium]|nr:hypothetical protein [Blastocatellia bacterium]
MRHRNKAKAEVFHWTKGRETLERLRYAAACKLCMWHEHQAGGGSCYVTIGGSLKLRFADHENTSAQYGEPDFNFVKRTPTEQELQEIVARIQYARLCKKTAFAMHVDLTVPKLKKLLKPECFEGVCENQAYPTTFTEYVVVATAFETLETVGITERIPVRQELYSMEDYSGL